MKKSVLFSVLSLSGGGAERVVSVWANALSQRGYDVSVLVFKRCPEEYPVLPSVRILEAARTPEEYLAMSFMQRFKKIRSLIKGAKPEYVLSFLSTAQFWTAIAAFGVGIKRIETVRNNPWRDGGGRISRMIRDLCYRSGWRIIIQAKDQAPYFGKFTRKRCVLIPNPISETYTGSFREKFDRHCTQFIAAGRISPQKNYPMMIRAFAEVARENPELTLRIFGVGSEEYTKTIRDLIAQENMQERILLMGRSSSMEKEYKAADGFLMSSDYEGLPNALMEAMASRLICISTDCKTGPSDLIDHGKNGYLVAAGDEKALADQIRLAAGMDIAQCEAMADAAREKIMQHCSPESSTDLLCRLMN